MLRLKEMLHNLVQNVMPTLAFAGGEARSTLWRLPTTCRLKGRDKSLAPRLVITSMLGDAVVIAAALCWSFWLRFHTSISEFGVPDTLELADYFGYILLGTGSLICTLSSFGIYERTAMLRVRFVSLQILKATCAWFAVFMALALFFRLHPELSRVYALISGFLVPVWLLLWRLGFCHCLHHSAAVHSLRQRVLFVGWNPEAVRLARTFRRDHGRAYELIGCVLARHGQVETKDDVRVLGHVKDIEDIIPRLSIDMVVLTDVDCMKDHIVGLANACSKELAQFKVIPSYFQILVTGLHLETVGGIPVLGVTRLPLDRFHNVLLKRAVDIVGAVVGLCIAAPLTVIFGTLVYLESPGPIIYRQRRLGRDGHEFDIYKIRSMKLDAEAAGKPGWTTKDDPRRLRVGGFMRRTNIDEVPQFWNVLRGEMSLVGPRPERPELIRNFKHEIPHYNARHNTLPGITGWAQVNGLRGDTDLGERIKCDLWYQENWSPLLDVAIMFMTFFKRDNAC